MYIAHPSDGRDHVRTRDSQANPQHARGSQSTSAPTNPGAAATCLFDQSSRIDLAAGALLQRLGKLRLQIRTH
ncbi:hypothetical protein B0I29_12436 [Actinoplanes lutulentus]|uniref:Uncharacterized protein n=1 Tax=Actinoplanes lutulentus TaxID=1287878 RepID=A0A327Z0R4_9ACTN|nr:hypothetical protein B0I29_12436 [Actinoplanes lutulentus]